MKRLVIGFAVYLSYLSLDAFGQSNPDLIQPPQAIQGGNFGSTITLLNDQLLIGSPGAEIVWRLTEDGAEIQALQKPNPSAVDRFGSAIAVLKGDILIGAPGDTSGTGQAFTGAVYRFEAQSGQLIQPYFNPDPKAGDRFGSTIAGQGSDLFVGAPFGKRNPMSGVVYRLDGQSGQVVNEFVSPTPIEQDQFGSSIAVVGNLLIVGAPSDSSGTGVLSSGVVYVFDVTTGEVVLTILNPTPDVGDFFGAAVAAFQEDFLIASTFEEVNGNRAGVVYLFEGDRNSSNFGQVIRTYANPDGFDDARFGLSIASRDERLIIGAPGSIVVPLAKQPFSTGRAEEVQQPVGAAYIFNGITGSLIRRLTDPENSTTDFFGTAVAISATKAYVGSPNADIIPNAGNIIPVAGAVYAYSLQQSVVINEILYDPNYEDLVFINNAPSGRERIELKNVGQDTVSLTNAFLFIMREEPDTLRTLWRFPNSTRIAPGELLVVHWLASGKDDAGNVFTGPPNSDTGFISDSFDARDVVLGGPSNTAPFALALFSASTLDFMQIGGNIATLDTLPGRENLWIRGEFVDFVPEGHSIELKATPIERTVTRPDDFFIQSSPSIGFDNVLADPPPAHLLITEVCVRPRIGEFVEIFNPTDSPISLADYYLTDNVNFKDNAYTLLVKGEDALNLGDRDFLVKFPDNAEIQPDSFQTIAFRADDFERRYRQNPTYEILDTDPNVTNMDTISLGSGDPTFNDPNEVAILFKWNREDTSDLVEDVDYVVWGEFTDAPVLPLQAQLADVGETPEAVIPAGPLNEAVDKTGLGIDGQDGDLVRSYYDNDTADSLQTPVGEFTHAFLKSWQRRPGRRGVGPVEFGELTAGGNGVSGHDESSEKLSVAFVERSPTPHEDIDNEGILLVEVTDTFVDEIDPNGRSNGVINPDERIRYRIELTNFGVTPTGPLQTFLRTSESVVTLEDSTSNFPSIVPNGSALSSDEYVFTIQDTLVPDSLRFALLIIQKSPEASKNRDSELQFQIPDFNLDEFNDNADNNYIQLVDIKPTLIIQGGDTTFAIEHRLANTLQGDCHAQATEAEATIMPIADSLIEAVESSVPITDYGDMCPGDTTINRAFVFRTNGPFNGDEAPEITFRINWTEDGNSASANQIMDWQPLSTFKIQGTLRYPNNDQTIAGAVVKLSQNAIIIATDTSDADGSYTFEPQVPGDYSINVTHTGVPQAAIQEEDATAACRLAVDCETGLRTQEIRRSANFDVFTRIAADVDGDSVITQDDVDEITSRAHNQDPCMKFTIGRDWAFVDALTSVDPGNFFEAERSLSFTLQNFSFQQLDFVGLVYGDVKLDLDDPNDLDDTVCTVHMIAGAVRFHLEPRAPVGNTLITLNDGGVGLDTTDTINGRFGFSELTEGLTYTLRPFKTGDFNSGSIDSDDLDLLKGHLDNNPLEPDQILAADLDEDGSITALDSLFMELFLAGDPQIDENGAVGHAGEWRFLPESQQISQLTSDEEVAFNAVLLGDLDGDWMPAPSTAVELQPSRQALLEDVQVAPGEILALPLRVMAEQPIRSLALDLLFEESHLEFLNIVISDALSGYQIEHNCLNGRLRVDLTSPGNPVTTNEFMELEFEVIGKTGEVSEIEILDLTVNDGMAANAQARVTIVQGLPDEFFMAQNYPNPFNASTTIEYGLPKKEHVRVQIYNVIGQIVDTPVDKHQDAGRYRLEWPGPDAQDRNAPSGVYIVRLEAGEFSKVRKITLLK